MNNTYPSIPSSWNAQLGSQQLASSPLATLLREPDEITASENMQRFVLSAFTNNPSANKSAATVSVDGNLDYNIPATFVVQGGGVTVTLVASNTPSFNEFFSNNGFSTLDRIRLAQAIAYELQNNLAFNNLYEVEAIGTTIIFTARSYGDYDLVFTLPINTSLVSSTSGSGLYSYNLVEDYSSFTEVYTGWTEFGDAPDRSTYYQVGVLDVPFNDNEIEYTTNSLTKNYVDVVFPLKKLNQSISVTKLDEIAIDAGKEPIMRPYFTVFGDSYRYVTNGEKKRIVQGCSSIRWVQNAARPKLDAYKLDNYVWNPGSSTQFQFLTERPDRTQVTYDSHQFIQFITKKKGKGTWWLEVKSHFYDGTDQTTLFGGAAGYSYTDFFGNCSIDVSPAVLGLEGIETAAGKLIDWYEVAIVWTTSPTSGSFRSYPATYRMLRRCNDKSINLNWFNKLGAWDSLEFIGTQAKQLQRSQKEVQRALPFDANIAIGATLISDAVDSEITLTYKTDSNTLYSAESGLMTRDHYDWIRGILDSPSVIVFDRSQRQFRAIVITDYEYLWNNDNTEFNLRVSYKYTVDNNTIGR